MPCVSSQCRPNIAPHSAQIRGLLFQRCLVRRRDVSSAPHASAHHPVSNWARRVGDAGPESNDWGFYFKGQQIIKSLFAQLLFGFTYTTTDIVHFSNHTHEDVTTSTFYQLTSQDRVLFAGCSAGARGAMFNLDYIQAMLPPDMAPVIGFFDSPLWCAPMPPSIERAVSSLWCAQMLPSSERAVTGARGPQSP